MMFDKNFLFCVGSIVELALYIKPNLTSGCYGGFREVFEITILEVFFKGFIIRKTN